MSELPARYWTKVHKTEGCWLWIGAKNPRGYGKMLVNGRYIDAHRLSYAAHHEEPGAGYVLHRCDNPSCVRPDHLFLGSQAENIMDMVEKDRQSKGSRVKGTKLTPEMIPLIFAMRREGLSYAKIARIVGVTQTAIWQVVNNRTFKWVQSHNISSHE